MGLKIFQVPCSEDGDVSMQICLELMAEENNNGPCRGWRLSCSSLVKSNLVDKLVIYRAPMIIGGDGIAAWHPWV